LEREGHEIARKTRKGGLTAGFGGKRVIAPPGRSPKLTRNSDNAHEHLFSRWLTVVEGEMARRYIIGKTIFASILFVLVGCNSIQRTAIVQETALPTSIVTQNTLDDLNPTATNTPHPTLDVITSTTTVIPTSILTDIMDDKLIIIRDFSVNYIEDIQSGRGELLPGKGQWANILKWDGNGCTLIVGLDDGIYEMNLQGEILHTIFPYNLFPQITGGQILLSPSYARRAIDMLSPDGSWIAYKIGSGILEQRGDDLEPFRYEFENVETIPTDGAEGPFQLSQRGGAWRLSWSPDSLYLAYSDYDEHGIHQLYVTSRKGTDRKQLTFLANPVEIMKILWSPDGNKIAVLIDQTGDNSADETRVIDVRNGTANVFNNIYAQWWRDSVSIIAMQSILQEEGFKNIIVLDINASKISTINTGTTCNRINPFGNPWMIGCLSFDHGFSAINSRTHSVEHYSKFNFYLNDIQYWIAAPDSFPGAEGCRDIP
jgi:hypothetical protein